MEDLVPGLSLPKVASGSRGHSVASVLRDAITEGSMSPGDRLLETELAREFGTSNGPVREALRQLEAEGLVVSAPYRGAVVAAVSQEEIEEVLVPIRVIIETFAFRRALPGLLPEDYTGLAELVTEMRAAADTDDPARLAEADLQFHELVIRRSGHNHCLQLWKVIQPRVRSYFRRDAPSHQAHYAVADQHDRLLRALRAKDEAALLAEVEEHIHTHLGPELNR